MTSTRPLRRIGPDYSPQVGIRNTGTRNSPQESAVPCAFFRFQSARRVGRLMDLRQAPYLRVGGSVGLCDHPSHDFRYHVIRI